MGWDTLLAQLDVTQQLALVAERRSGMQQPSGRCQLFPWLWPHPVPSSLVASGGCFFVPHVSSCPDGVLAVPQHICHFHGNSGDSGRNPSESSGMGLSRLPPSQAELLPLLPRSCGASRLSLGGGAPAPLAAGLPGV